MKLTIDTKNKTIELKEDVKLNELYNTLDKMFPSGWGDFTLVVNGFTSAKLSSAISKPYNPYIGTGEKKDSYLYDNNQVYGQTLSQ